MNYKVSSEKDQYNIDFTFMNIDQNQMTFKLHYSKEKTDQMISKFGIPRWMFEPYVDNEYNRRIRQNELQKGMFMLVDNTIEVNKTAVVNYYGETFCKPVAKLIAQSLSESGRDNRRNRIEMAMRFVQDIPYGIPKYQDNKRHYGGVSPPPKVLIDGFGDCDSKALLFASILSWLIPSDDIIFLNQSDHVLTAIKGDPEPGLTYIRFRDEDFLVAETAGPGIRKLGEEGNYYRNKFNPEPLTIAPPKIFPFGDQSQIGLPYNKPAVGPGMLVIQNDARREIKFQVSTDTRHWQAFTLSKAEVGRFNFEDHQLVFIRFREKNSRYKVFRIRAGAVYDFNWDEQNRRWEFN